jgi:hypothetical protein
VDAVVKLAVKRDDKYGKGRPWIVLATTPSETVEFGPLPNRNQAGILRDDIARLLHVLRVDYDYVEEANDRG